MDAVGRHSTIGISGPARIHTGLALRLMGARRVAPWSPPAPDRCGFRRAERTCGMASEGAGGCLRNTHPPSMRAVSLLAVPARRCSVPPLHLRRAEPLLQRLVD
jgi:hypothetical protein